MEEQGMLFFSCTVADKEIFTTPEVLNEWEEFQNHSQLCLTYVASFMSGSFNSLV